MPAAKVNLDIDQGATFRKQFVWKVGKPLVPVDLTGCTARMQLRPETGSSTVIIDLTTENGGIVLGDTDGTVEIVMTDEQTAAMSFDSAVYDTEIIFPGGDVIRLLRGSVSLSLEVTRVLTVDPAP